MASVAQHPIVFWPRVLPPSRRPPSPHPAESVPLALSSSSKAFRWDIYRADTLMCFNCHFSRRLSLAPLFNIVNHPSTPYALPGFIFLHSTYHYLIHYFFYLFFVSPILNVMSMSAEIFDFFTAVFLVPAMNLLNEWLIFFFFSFPCFIRCYKVWAWPQAHGSRAVPSGRRRYVQH